MGTKKVTSVWSCNHLQGVEGADDVDLGWTVEVRCADGSTWYFPGFGTRRQASRLLGRVRRAMTINTDLWVHIIRGGCANPSARTEFDILMHGGE